MHCDRESPTEAPRSRVTRRSGWTISLELLEDYHRGGANSVARGDDYRAKPARHQSTQKTILDLPSSLDHFVLAPILPAPALGLSSFDIKREQN